MKINKIDLTKLEGIKNMPKAEETLEKQLEKMISKLTERAEREVADYGDFSPVFETMANPDKKFKATNYVLKIHKPQGSDPKTRILDAAAYEMPSPYKYERTLIEGTKEEILKALKEKDFITQAKETFERLASHFD